MIIGDDDPDRFYRLRAGDVFRTTTDGPFMKVDPRDSGGSAVHLATGALQAFDDGSAVEPLPKARLVYK